MGQRFAIDLFRLRKLAAIITQIEQRPGRSFFFPAVSIVMNQWISPQGGDIGIFSDIEFRVEYSGFLDFFKTGMGESEP